MQSLKAACPPKMTIFTRHVVARRIEWFAIFFALHSVCAEARWDFNGGEEDPLCIAMHRRLNQYIFPSDPLKKTNNCAWNAALTLPDFSQPPWEELNPLKHEELIFRLLRYSQGTFGASQKAELRIRAETQRFIRRGGRVQLWRTRLVNDFRIPDHPEFWTPPGLQNVIQLRETEDAAAAPASSARHCPKLPRADWAGRTFIVNDDLTDVHQKIGATGPILASSTTLLYKGSTIFLTGDVFGIELSRDEGSGPSRFCAINDRVNYHQNQRK